MIPFMLIGLTGGISTGKSAVTALLEKEGVPVVDADKIARQVVEPGQPAYIKIVAAFGEDILEQPVTDMPADKRRIDRAKLGRVVFDRADLRKYLNRCTHPHIKDRIFSEIVRYWLQGNRLIVLDAPLLFESGLDRWMTDVVVIYCPAEVQLSRLLKRNPDLTEEEAMKRIKAQLPMEEKVKRAGIVIDNSGSIEDLNDKVARFVVQQRLRWKWFVLKRIVIISAPFALLWLIAKALRWYLK